MERLLQKKEWHVQRVGARESRVPLRNKLMVAGAHSLGWMWQEMRLGRYSGPDLIYSGPYSLVNIFI